MENHEIIHLIVVALKMFYFLYMVFVYLFYTIVKLLLLFLRNELNFFLFIILTNNRHLNEN